MKFRKRNKENTIKFIIFTKKILTMTDQLLYSKIFLLQSEPLKQELLFFIDYLLTKQFADKQNLNKRTPKFGCAKGKFKMSDDFDAPLDHFNEYMP